MRLSSPRVGLASALVALTALAACQQNPDGRLALAGSAYCTKFPTSNSGGANAGVTQAADPATTFDDCIHRWAYALAPSRDPADVVAQASMDACSAQLRNWSQQLSAAQPAPAPPTRGGEGQAQQPQNTAVAQEMRGAEARSLFYVVQARASGCSPPPASTLTTSPLT